MKDEFSRMHPAVSFAYFAAVLTFSMWFTHPVLQLVSLSSAFAYSIYLRGGRAVRTDLLGLVPLMLVTALLNPAFSHEGETILAYLPSGNPLTEESVLYGLSAGAMLAAVICWFTCLNEVMTSDKFVYLFGRIAPSLSLLLSMTLRFVPCFGRQFRRVSGARRAAGMAGGGAGEGAAVLSGVAGWAMENAVDTADSMRGRGWGLKGRTAYSIYSFTGRDLRALAGLGACLALLLYFKFTGALYFRWYPAVRGASGPAFLCAAAVYAALCLAPLAIDAVEGIRWKTLKSGI